MRRVVALAALAAVALLCISGDFREAVPPGTLVAVGLAALILGGRYGAAYARARRGWSDYRFVARQLPVSRRAAAGGILRAARWAALIALIVVAVAYGVGNR